MGRKGEKGLDCRFAKDIITREKSQTKKVKETQPFNRDS